MSVLSPDQSASASFPIVGIGASAGGLEAFTQLLKHLPAETGLAFVLIQHLDPTHESALTQILSRTTSMPVSEVTNNLRVERNRVYVMPPGANMTIAKGVLKLSARREAGAPHRDIDFFLESLAQDKREQAIGVVLSGTASDGTLGLEAIKAENGITFAQDDSAKYDSMPRSAAAAGCVDFVLSPKGIAKELARLAKHPYLVIASSHSALDEEDSPRRGRPAKAKAEQSRSRPADNGFAKILSLLHSQFGIDFSFYKPATIQRRVARRMTLSKRTSLEAYASYLSDNSRELEALYSDVLINVSSFFRNPEAFDVLKRKVFPNLLARAQRDKPLRVWVPGCAAGQEAYSIAMTFLEASQHVPHPRKLQVFATDINEALLNQARRGLYATGQTADISPNRLKRFFAKENGGYRISKPLRQMVVFARQNFFSDPPFSRMDLISCRNLLIYLEASLQKKVLPTFHYALNDGGYLFLGASESVSPFTDLFEPVDKKRKIYAKKSGPLPSHYRPIADGQPAEEEHALPVTRAPKSFGGEINAQREADRVTVNQFAPPGVLINAALQVVEFRGSTGAYLAPPTGRATYDVLKMARDGLMLPLRAAIDKAKRENKPAREAGVRRDRNGGSRPITVEVIPLKNLKERCYLVFFEEKAGSAGIDPSPAEATEKTAGASRKAQSIATKKEDSRHAAELERELSEMRDYLQGVQDRYEVANEELQASNEEVQSANEELQSINEELETSKEELESSNEELGTLNEELTTLNEELTSRNTELNRLYNDLDNLHGSINTAVLLLGRDLTIRRFTPVAEKLFNLLAVDAGRSLRSIRHNLDCPDLDALIAEVIDTVREREREVRDNEGRWYSLRVRPYKTIDGEIDGAVLVLVDIDALKRSEQAVAHAHEYDRAILRTTREPLVVLDADLRIDRANEAFYRTYQFSPDETKGHSIFEIGSGAWDTPKLHELLEDILPRNSFFDNVEVVHDFPHIGRRTMLLNARRLEGESPEHLLLLSIEDVTERLESRAAMRVSEQRYRRLFEEMRDGVLLLDPDARTITDANPSVAQMLGYAREEMIGKQLFQIGVIKEEATCRAFFQELEKKQLVRYASLAFPTKAGEECQVEFVSNLYRENGRHVIQCHLRDISERMRAENLRTLMMNELNHRVKNTLSIVMSIAAQSLKGMAGEAYDTFSSRLVALSRVHNLLAGEKREGASLRGLLDQEMEPYRARQGANVVIEGPDAWLAPKASVALSLAFHELATNAAKYGAFSDPAGQVRVTWTVRGPAEHRMLKVVWAETGGPPVKSPKSKGFGLTLIEDGLSFDVDAEVGLDFDSGGLICTIDMPLPEHWEN